MTSAAWQPPAPIGDLYKFVGMPDPKKPEDLLWIFDAIFVEGSMKFGAALNFNDPFEFKFSAQVPASLQLLEAWHATHAPERSPEERLNAWRNLQGNDGPAKWRAQVEPRLQLLSQSYVLCLAQVWDSPLLWAHYASMHNGFCAILDHAALTAYARHPDYGMGSATCLSFSSPIGRTPRLWLRRSVKALSCERKGLRPIRLQTPGRRSLAVLSPPDCFKPRCMGSPISYQNANTSFGDCFRSLPRRLCRARQARPSMSPRSLASCRRQSANRPMSIGSPI